MQPVILKQDFDSEFFTEEQCFITELSNSSNDPDVSIARARLKPGVTTRWHRLSGTVERYFVLSGSGRVEVGELTAQEVTAGDSVLIPAMCRQRITNTGNDDLIFLAICSPRFLQKNYQDIEDQQS